MNHKARRYITILLTFVFCVCAFSAAAFAETQDETDPGDHTASSKLSSASSDQSSSSSSPSSDPFIPATVQITLIYDNGQQSEVKTVNVGTPVSALPTPSRDGYKFAGWKSGGGILSSSSTLDNNAVLTASWVKIAVSSSARSSKPPESSQTPVDTHQSEVEAIASQADQATSDPDALGSQDWSDLLSSSPASSAAAETESEASSSGAEQTNSGGFSWLFALGVALIVLALGGIGLFVYLQFFSNPRGGNGPRGGGKKDDDTMVFTDVSSFSNPSEHTGSGRDSDLEDTIPIGPKRSVSVPPEDAPGTEAGTDEPVRTAKTAKAARPPVRIPKESETTGELPPLSQAKPVPPAEGGKNNFDWEKFFNEDDDDTTR